MYFNEKDVLTDSTQKASIYLDKWSALAHSLAELTKQIAGIADQPLWLQLIASQNKAG